MFTIPADYAPTPSRDELINALRLIQHATAPTHDDGAFHENAYEIADEMVKKVDAAEAYVAAFDARAALSSADGGTK